MPTHMNKELLDYYENRFDMMTTKGWQDFIEDVQAMFDSHNQIGTVDTFEEFHKRKGQVDILQWILSLKSVSEQTYEGLLNEKD